VASDLEEMSLPSERFSVVICVKLFAAVAFSQIERRCAGGMLLFRDLHGCAARLWRAGRVIRITFLELGELRTAFPSLQHLFLSGVAGWEGNCEFDCAEGGLRFGVAVGLLPLLRR